MADYKKEEEGPSARGVDWEVVSLTASAYAAAPGPEGSSLADDGKEFSTNEEEYARAMFMSGHFVFPPIEHENLPLESDDNEILAKFRVQDVDTIEEVPDVPEKIQEETWKNKSLSEADDVHVIRFSEEGERLCTHGVVFEDDTTSLQGLKLIKGGGSMYSYSDFSSFHSETDIDRSLLFDDDGNIVESKTDDPNQDLDLSPRPVNQSKHNVSRIPSESVWKRRATLLYAHAKEASTFWSLCVAATLMGLVILGQRWQKGRWQVHSVNDEKTRWILGPVTRFKDVISGSHRRPPGSSLSGR